MASYWSRVLERRVTRRRALAATGGFGAGAALLAACRDDGPNLPEDKSGLLIDPKDESKEAKRGGVYIDSHPGVIITHDPMKTGINIRGARRGFSQLFRVADAVLAGADGTIEGDLAESWEMTPDRLTLTLRLESNAGFANIPPVNGRMVDADDVVYSYERLQREGIGRTEIVNAINPGAPVVSMNAIDNRTLVIRLAEPNVTIFSLLGTDVLGSMYIMPKESGSQYEPARVSIGSGPYYLVDNSEVRYSWKKNPNFKRSQLTDGEPYIDEIQEPVIPDAAAATAQFRSGAIYEYQVPQLEVLTTKRDNPQLDMRRQPPAVLGTERIIFGLNQDSIFKDERVRIAYMKSIDRDAFIAAAHNTDNFAKEGLPTQTFWDSSLARGVWEGWWLDPKDEKAFGANAKNHVYDIAEAKKLLEAAGLRTPVEFTQVYAAPAPTSFPVFYYTRADIFMGMLENSVIFKMNRKLINYQTEWNSEQYRFSGGRFTGVTWGPDTASSDPTSAVFFAFNSQGGYYQGGENKELDDLTNSARREFENKRRQELVHEVQRQNGRLFFNPKIGSADSFALNWPIVRNVNVYRGGTNWMCITTPSGLKAWLDPSRPPATEA